LKRLLERALSVIKALCGQIVLLNPHESTQQYLAILKNISVNDEVEIGNILNRLQKAIAAHNEQILSKKADRLTTKYLDDTRHNKAINDINLWQYKESLIDSMCSSKSVKKLEEIRGEFQMTFQPNTVRDSKGKVDSVSRSIKDWKTFVAGMEENSSDGEDEQEEHILKENISTNKLIRNTNKKSINTSTYNHFKDNSLSHIEDAMKSFLGEFKDIKSELTQIGESIQSCISKP